MKVLGLFDCFLLLQIGGNNDARDRSLRFGDPNCAIHQMPDLRRMCSLLDVFIGDVFEKGNQIHLLLITPAYGLSRGLADDGDHGGMVHFGVVKSIEQMNCARTGGGKTDAHLSCEFGVGAGHEGRHFFMPRLNEFDSVGVSFRALERAHDPVDPIAWITKYSFDSPLMKPFD